MIKVKLPHRKDKVEHGVVRAARAFVLAPQIIAHGAFLPWKPTVVDGWFVIWNPDDDGKDDDF